MAGPTTTPVPGSLEESALQALIGILKSAASPEAAHAQALILRRLALEGDVVGSRIPAPRNISEIGGYINLLTDLNQPELRSQMLAGALGVSGPNPPLGWLPSQPPLSWVTLANDRPEGPSQPAIPLSLSVRSDFATALENGLRHLHEQGCQLPLLAPAHVLPPAVGGQAPVDLLPLLGRTLGVVPAVALHDPDQDPVAMARRGADPFSVVARVIESGRLAVAPDAWDGLRCDAAACTVVPAPAAGRRYVPVAPALASAGFYAAAPLHQPINVNDLSWARFNNLSGLVADVTRLQDELMLLYPADEIGSSALVNRLQDVWNGTTFARS